MISVVALATELADQFTVGVLNLKVLHRCCGYSAVEIEAVRPLAIYEVEARPAVAKCEVLVYS